MIDRLGRGPVAIDTVAFIYFIARLATALAVQATSFVTNDRELPALPGLRVARLDEELPSRD